MTHRKGLRWISVLGLALIGCGAPATEDSLDDTDVNNVTDALTAPLTVTAGRSSDFRFTTSAGRLSTVTINCTPPADPDAVGVVFGVTAPDLGLASNTSQPPRAGYFSWTGTLPAGTHTVSVTGYSGTGACRIITGTGTGMCGRTIFRSPNANHTHFRVGTDTSSDWEAFPVSGNHWGAWPAWNSVYTRPVLRGFLLHGLEHGGIVLSYNCRSATESAECRDAHAQLVALAQRFGYHRLIVTPDPTQTTRFAIRAWRWGYTADCLDATAALQYMRARYRHGREDIDADPPIPYDPTTTNVPCQDLMAAPDSCPM